MKKKQSPLKKKPSPSKRDHFTSSQLTQSSALLRQWMQTKEAFQSWKDGTANGLWKAAMRELKRMLKSPIPSDQRWAIDQILKFAHTPRRARPGPTAD